MKKVNWRGLLFLVLILALASGLSYFGLNQVINTEDDKEVQKMAIALVNEDEGAIFNDNYIAFGDEFSKSIARNNTHDWYVVSRGVAENGYENNSYNMMIVIPNDFSEKAISIDSGAPERVVLNYKVNASGHDEVKAEAEKTASLILNDFNRRIIDVYFASIIGNLQDAQDNIGTIVEKEGIYTNTYKDSINSPLSNYTTQFEAVKDNTKRSKESFTSLEDILGAFQNTLHEDVQTNHNYLTNINDYSKIKLENGLLLSNYSDQFNQFGQMMHNTDVLQQLDQLELANNAIYDQFQKREDDTSNIISNATKIQAYFNQMTGEIDELEKNLNKTLESDLHSGVKEKLAAAFKDGFDEKEIYLNTFFNELDGNAQQQIQNQIVNLPSLELADISQSGLSDKVSNQLKNVIIVTNKYIAEENQGYVHSPDKSNLLSTKVNDVKAAQSSNGVTMTDIVEVQDKLDGQQVFSLHLPKNIIDHYQVNNLLLTFSDGQRVDFTGEYNAGTAMILQGMGSGRFTVELTLKLNSVQSDIDVFQPFTWRWELHPEKATTRSESNTAAKETKETTETTETTETEETKKEDSTVASTEDEQEADEPIPEIITVVNNHMYHQVMSPSINDATQVLIDAASDTVSQYQKMLGLYEFYYGFNMDNLDGSIESSSLKDIAKGNQSSLYYLYNESNIIELLTDFAVDHVADEVTDQVRQPIQALHNKVSAYKELVDNVDQNSIELADKITETTEQADILNTSIRDSLSNLSAWRDKSIDLAAEQMEILTNESGEQTAIMSLDSDFKNLLMESESLAGQAEGNLLSAEGVYQTFEAIDEQASTIQKSGIALVDEAEDLSVKMTDKLLENQNYADNFADVLSNSRTGDRQNEDLYSFLSNPVETKNDGTIIAGDTFTPYFLVLILSILALFTAYVLSTYNQKKMSEDQFESEKTLIGKNISITTMIASVGIVEGIIIGVLSSYLLQVDQVRMVVWIAIITLIMLTMLVIATYLLRQLKMVGMFILLVIFSLYLFFTEALGFNYNAISFVETLRSYSPLQYIETLLSTIAKGVTNNQPIILAFMILIAGVLIGVMANLLVIYQAEKTEGMADEDVTETH